MPDWDDDGPTLFDNLREAQRLAVDDALARRTITLDGLKAWHRVIVRGLAIHDAARLGVDPADLAGEFRGPPKLPGIEAEIGEHFGAPSSQVASECRAFIATLQALIRALDAHLPADKLDDLDADGLYAVAEAAAWAHGEWVRIHPFANGNGRTARLLGNAILVRYGLRPVFRLRPRPSEPYAIAADLAMEGDHQALADYVIAQLLQT
jgi:Fic family protein